MGDGLREHIFTLESVYQSGFLLHLAINLTNALLNVIISSSLLNMVHPILQIMSLVNTSIFHRIHVCTKKMDPLNHISPLVSTVVHLIVKYSMLTVYSSGMKHFSSGFNNPTPTELLHAEICT